MRGVRERVRVAADVGSDVAPPCLDRNKFSSLFFIVVCSFVTLKLVSPLDLLLFLLETVYGNILD